MQKKKGEEENKLKNKQMDMVNTEKRKEKTGGTTTELPTNTPALSRKQNKSYRQKLNENNREKSKSRKVNRNPAGLCTNE